MEPPPPPTPPEVRNSKTVYTVETWNMNDKKGPPPNDLQPSTDVVAVPQASAVGMPQCEYKCRRLISRSESIEVQYLRLFPAATYSHGMRFASTGKLVRPRNMRTSLHLLKASSACLRLSSKTLSFNLAIKIGWKLKPLNLP